MQNFHAGIKQYATEIRQLAASCQTRSELADVKVLIDDLIRSVSADTGGDPASRLNVWTALQHELRRYFSGMPDPRWLDAVNHALHRIHSRRQTALKSRKIINKMN